MKNIVEQAKLENEYEGIQIALRNLIILNQDAALGYGIATRKLRSDKYKNHCHCASEQRAEFVEELRPMIAKYGGEPPAEQSEFGPLHDAWITIEEMSEVDDEAVIQECKRVDKLAIDLYEEAISEDFTEDVKTVLRTQLFHLLTLLEEAEM